jgi:hypothetical protein
MALMTASWLSMGTWRVRYQASSYSDAMPRDRARRDVRRGEGASGTLSAFLASSPREDAYAGTVYMAAETVRLIVETDMLF